MRMPEQRLWDRFRASLAAYGFAYERIENIVGDGIPDVVVCRAGVVSFVEMKAVAAWPARAATPVLGRKGLNVAQHNWAFRWWDAGARVFTLVGVGPTERVLVPAGRFENINAATKEELLPYKRSWPEIVKELGHDH